MNRVTHRSARKTYLLLVRQSDHATCTNVCTNKMNQVSFVNLSLRVLSTHVSNRFVSLDAIEVTGILRANRHICVSSDSGRNVSILGVVEAKCLEFLFGDNTFFESSGTLNADELFTMKHSGHHSDTGAVLGCGFANNAGCINAAVVCASNVRIHNVLGTIEAPFLYTPELINSQRGVIRTKQLCTSRNYFSWYSPLADTVVRNSGTITTQSGTSRILISCGRLNNSLTGKICSNSQFCEHHTEVIVSSHTIRNFGTIASTNARDFAQSVLVTVVCEDLLNAETGAIKCENTSTDGVAVLTIISRWNKNLGYMSTCQWIDERCLCRYPEIKCDSRGVGQCSRSIHFRGCRQQNRITRRLCTAGL